MTKENLYRSLESFMMDYSSESVTLDKDHIRVILENKRLALKNANIQSAVNAVELMDVQDEHDRLMKKADKRAAKDQALVISQEAMIKELKELLSDERRQRLNAVAEGLRAIRCPKNITAYDSTGRGY